MCGVVVATSAALFGCITAQKVKNIKTTLTFRIQEEAEVWGAPVHL